MLWWIVGAIGVVLLVAGAMAYQMAHRLDRLHIRCDLAAVALEQSLRRRHTVAVAVAETVSRDHPDVAANLHGAIDAARARMPEHFVAGAAHHALELAENRLTQGLNSTTGLELPGTVHAELVDVCDRLAMAHRFYNDAVRDTRRLRGLAGVRLFRLAGNAPLPEYVELSNPSYN